MTKYCVRSVSALMECLSVSNWALAVLLEPFFASEVVLAKGWPKNRHRFRRLTSTSIQSSKYKFKFHRLNDGLSAHLEDPA